MNAVLVPREVLPWEPRALMTDRIVHFSGAPSLPWGRSRSDLFTCFYSFMERFCVTETALSSGTL